MSITITQAPCSYFTGTSLAALKGAEELLTDKFLFSVLRCQIRQVKKVNGYAILLNLLSQDIF